jgi:hypothetical protein
MKTIPEEIEVYRDRKWRRDEILKIETAAGIESLVEDIGFCLTLTDSRTVSPSVYILFAADAMFMLHTMFRKMLK